ncbi:MAG: acetoin utilization protein AcuC [Cellulomonadaceae bacterium]
MASTVRVVWSPALLGYDFGPGHPMAPLRLGLTMELAAELNLLDLPGVDLGDSGVASDETIELFHDPAYVAAVRAASEHGVADPARGLGTDDDPIFPGMHDAAARIVAGTCTAARDVWAGRVDHAVNIAGGMHHARADAASGFCVYNDAAVAIRALLADGAQRVAYVDLDAHHGDGVESAFYDDPRVLTVSVHQSGATLFPGTGFPTDTGTGAGAGTAVNLALPPRTDGASWLRAVDAVVPEVLRAFEPQILVTQHGCDAHASDPLSDLRVNVVAQRKAAAWMHDLAHELCEGRWVALGGGGYAVTDVVPLAWSHLVALAAHHPIPAHTPVPATWRARVERDFGVASPVCMTEGESDEEVVGLDSLTGLPSPDDVAGTIPVGSCTMPPGGDDHTPWTSGYDPSQDVDRAVQATRQASFPLLGVHHDGY